ncbi:hypothetical protein RhiirB3_396663, partial [Rhizophagus irregularis]
MALDYAGDMALERLWGTRWTWAFVVWLPLVMLCRVQPSCLDAWDSLPALCVALPALCVVTFDFISRSVLRPSYFPLPELLPCQRSFLLLPLHYAEHHGSRLDRGSSRHHGSREIMQDIHLCSPELSLLSRAFCGACACVSLRVASFC